MTGSMMLFIATTLRAYCDHAALTVTASGCACRESTRGRRPARWGFSELWRACPSIRGRKRFFSTLPGQRPSREVRPFRTDADGSEEVGARATHGPEIGVVDWRIG